ncbi:MAG: hypothetical protein IT458_04755 [Planctomycetes bacterium]|nr:hypothetical protein [Planctomycetota bacterium]
MTDPLPRRDGDRVSQGVTTALALHAVMVPCFLALSMLLAGSPAWERFFAPTGLGWSQATYLGPTLLVLLWGRRWRAVGGVALVAGATGLIALGWHALLG